jgi:hypothetical protein
MKLIFLVVVILVVCSVVFSLVLSGKSGGRAGFYKPRKLMTDNELEFFGRLVKALPDHSIFPQVALSALIEASSGDKKIAHGDRMRIAQQRVDYLVCDAGCAVVAVVELDDRTHSKPKDELRDARLAQAGINVIRFQSRNKPTIETIRDALSLRRSSPAASAAASARATRSAPATAGMPPA